MSASLSLRAPLAALFLCAAPLAAQTTPSPAPLAVVYAASPLRQVLADLATRSGRPIRALWIDESNPVGLDPDAPITADFSAATIEQALERILRVCPGDAARSATWQRDDAGYLVGPRARLDAYPIVRLYDIMDLTMTLPEYDDAVTIDLAAALSSRAGAAPLREQTRERPQSDRTARARELADLIRATVEPESWWDAGGSFTIVPSSGRLVVRAPGYIQRQIEDRTVR